MPKRLPKVLTEAEVQALWAGSHGEAPTCVRNRAMLAVMLGAGLRVAELVALAVQDVDLTEGMVRVCNGKGSRDRVVPIGAETVRHLGVWLQARGLVAAPAVFVSLHHGKHRGQGMTTRNVQQWLACLAERAGLPRRVTPHMLRHTYATTMLRRGLDLREVQTLLGHSSVATTEIYTHVDPVRLRDRVRGLGMGAAPAVETRLGDLERQVGELKALVLDLAGTS